MTDNPELQKLLSTPEGRKQVAASMAPVGSEICMHRSAETRRVTPMVLSWELEAVYGGIVFQHPTDRMKKRIVIRVATEQEYMEYNRLADADMPDPTWAPAILVGKARTSHDILYTFQYGQAPR